MNAAHDLVFYDGGCGLCHHAVRFLVARDEVGNRFVFAPLDGPTFRERVDEQTARGLPDSIVVLSAGGALLVRSDAAIHLLNRLGGPYRVLAGVLGVLPRGLRDRAYDLVAATRQRVFSKPDQACPVLPPKLRARFLP